MNHTNLKMGINNLTKLNELSDYDKLFYGKKQYIQCKCGIIVLECRYGNHLHSLRHEKYEHDPLPHNIKRRNRKKKGAKNNI